MTRDHFTDPPARRLGALCVIRDEYGAMLVMNKKRHEGEPTPWGLPGGCVEENQDIKAECARLVQEKLGIQVQVGRLLAVHHMPDKQYEDHLSKEGVNFVFDAGVVKDPEFMCGPTIHEAKFVRREELGEYLPAYNTARSVAALMALDGGDVGFLYN